MKDTEVPPEIFLCSNMFLSIFSLVIYYYMAVAAGNRKMVELLKEQLALVCTLYLGSRFSEMKCVCFVRIAEYERRDIVSTLKFQTDQLLLIEGVEKCEDSKLHSVLILFSCIYSGRER